MQICCDGSMQLCHITSTMCKHNASAKSSAKSSGSYCRRLVNIVASCRRFKKLANSSQSLSQSFLSRQCLHCLLTSVTMTQNHRLCPCKIVHRSASIFRSEHTGGHHCIHEHLLARSIGLVLLCCRNERA